MQVIIKFDGAKLSNIDTADDFLRRVQELSANGEVINVQNLSLVADGMPPDLCAASHPSNLIAGQSLPEADRSCVLKTSLGIYNPGVISHSALDSYCEHNGALNPSVALMAQNTELSSTFGRAVDNIASLISEKDPAPAALEHNNNAPRPF
ncbi:MAG: hypothetical protein ACK4VI_00430 [Alphaproteobacteria bacterium]